MFVEFGGAVVALSGGSVVMGATVVGNDCVVGAIAHYIQDHCRHGRIDIQDDRLDRDRVVHVKPE